MSEIHLMNEDAWLDYIEQHYGVRLGRGQLYIDARRGYVYAGSEYICRAGDPASPSDGTEWTEQINHMPRRTTGPAIETARRVSCGCESSVCNGHHTPGGCEQVPDGTVAMDFVGLVCNGCADRIEQGGGGLYLQRAASKPRKPEATMDVPVAHILRTACKHLDMNTAGWEHIATSEGPGEQVGWMYCRGPWTLSATLDAVGWTYRVTLGDDPDADPMREVKLPL